MKKTGVLFCLLLLLMIVGNYKIVQAAELVTEETSLVTFEELNSEEVFLKQSRRGTCTLASSAIIMRRAAMLSGNENWQSITESSLGSVAWRNGVGISWTFTYAGVTMTHDYVSSVEDLKRLLAEHPEGIVAYDSYKPHAIALTDYDAENDVFYCSDPSEACPSGRVPVSEALISLYNVDVVWYVTNPTGLTIASEEVETEEVETADETESDESDAIVHITEHPIVTFDKLSNVLE